MPKLIIKITDLIGADTGILDKFNIAAKICSPDPENIKTENQISGQVILIRIESGILGNFDLKTEIELSCARCLRKINLPIHLKYQQEFSYSGTNPPAGALNPDIQYTIYRDEADILPSVQQEILLSVPLKPLCEKKCQGIK